MNKTPPINRKKKNKKTKGVERVLNASNETKRKN